jgi:hypothetical protein
LKLSLRFLDRIVFVGAGRFHHKHIFPLVQFITRSLRFSLAGFFRGQCFRRTLRFSILLPVQPTAQHNTVRGKSHLFMGLEWHWSGIVVVRNIMRLQQRLVLCIEAIFVGW